MISGSYNFRVARQPDREGRLISWPPDYGAGGKIRSNNLAHATTPDESQNAIAVAEHRAGGDANTDLTRIAAF